MTQLHAVQVCLYKILMVFIIIFYNDNYVKNNYSEFINSEFINSYYKVITKIYPPPMHKPEKELPQEIRSLPQEETKCKFCGVSYLVHHEVKKLENELQRVQSELIKFYNEKEQLKELPILQSKIGELNNEMENWCVI